MLFNMARDTILGTLVQMVLPFSELLYKCHVSVLLRSENTAGDESQQSLLVSIG